MKKLLNPKWIFLINTVPVLFLTFLMWGEFSIIQSLLDEYCIGLWKTYAFVLGGITLLSTAYAVTQVVRKKKIDIIYCIATLIVYTVFIYIYYDNYDKLVPFDIPTWMLSGNLPMYVGGFLMLTLVHALFALVVLLTPHANKEKAGINTLLAIAIPFLFYILATIILPLWDGGDYRSGYLFSIIVIAGILAFLFFIIRSVYVLISRRNLYEEHQLAWKVPIAILFPLVGLFVNMLFDNMFGDFTNEWFFIIALVSGLLLCCPNPKNEKLRLLLFFGRCATFLYTIYFFIVLLPFLPLSIVAILLFGLGVLMLTPLLLFPIHLNDLVKDFNHLRRKYKKSLLYVVAGAALLVLPVGVTIDYLYDRKALHTTLEYLYSADYTKEYDLNERSIEKVLDVTDFNDKIWGVNLYSTTPYLSNYYKWLVLDNLSLSQNKRKLIKSLFPKQTDIDTKQFVVYDDAETQQNRAVETDIKITGVESESRYDATQNAWVSWIHLNITNGDTRLWNAEYKTTFDLPTGCWISDYYLYVEGEKEMGILAEKKAATWVFTQIRSENRDPGLLRYISGNTVEFKVFPFLQDETRLTGIEFIHKEPVDINIDGHVISLGKTGNAPIPNTIKDRSNNNIVYVTGEEKKQLETVHREPYYHFIVDMSAYKSNKDSDMVYTDDINERLYEKKKQRYAESIDKLLEKSLIDSKDARISFTNTYVEDVSLTADWKDQLKKRKCEGGFFPDRAIRKIFYDAYTNPKMSYPVIVIVSETIQEGVVFENLGDMFFAIPEKDIFYSLSDGELHQVSFAGTTMVSAKDTVTSIERESVKVWSGDNNRKVYLTNDNNPSVVLIAIGKVPQIKDVDIQAKNWNAGLQMQAQWMLQALYPETADAEWLGLIQNSFKSGIMSPLTSYIVVENEAQKAILKKKQKEVLSGHRSLDLNDDTLRMSEPDLLILVFILGFLYLLYRKRKSKTV